MAKAAILGHGVVGSGVAELLIGHADRIAGRAGEPIEVKYILDIREFPELSYADRFTRDFEQIVSDPEVGIVIEVIGGLHPAYDFVARALRGGKNVVTSNKELVAEKGLELLAIAREKGVKFLFEASVGGGIPILRPMVRCLAGNEIDSVCGILNGTTNYILTKMIRENEPFADALKTAQKLGYAEANPTADVEGIDACRKICILSALMTGKHISPSRISTEGITGITAGLVETAAKAGCVVKLLGLTRRTEQGIFAMVAPFAVAKEHPLAGVEDVFNGILVHGDAVDEVVFIGRGAGKMPTASAVVGDVIECVKAAGERNTLEWEEISDKELLPASEVAFRRLVCFPGGESRMTEPMDDAAFAAAYPDPAVRSIRVI